MIQPQCRSTTLINQIKPRKKMNRRPQSDLPRHQLHKSNKRNHLQRVTSKGTVHSYFPPYEKQNHFLPLNLDFAPHRTVSNFEPAAVFPLQRFDYCRTMVVQSEQMWWEGKIKKKWPSRQCATLASWKHGDICKSPTDVDEQEVTVWINWFYDLCASTCVITTAQHVLWHIVFKSKNLRHPISIKAVANYF